jgi:hypothetical protein
MITYFVTFYFADIGTAGNNNLSGFGNCGIQSDGVIETVDDVRAVEAEIKRTDDKLSEKAVITLLSWRELPSDPD